MLILVTEKIQRTLTWSRSKYNPPNTIHKYINILFSLCIFKKSIEPQVNSKSTCYNKYSNLHIIKLEYMLIIITYYSIYIIYCMETYWVPNQLHFHSESHKHSWHLSQN